jgi:hypothetical protein
MIYFKCLNYWNDCLCGKKVIKILDEDSHTLVIIFIDNYLTELMQRDN